MSYSKNEIKHNEILTAANGITLLRIAGTVALLFINTMSPLFLGIYTLTGLTDVPDGWAVCALAFAASLEELAIHIIFKDYNADRKSVFKTLPFVGDTK